MKKIVKLITILLLIGIAMAGCKKDIPPPLEKNQKFIINDTIGHPYTYLQNKYMDIVLAYELGKQGNNYNPNDFSYEQKFEKILYLDSIKEDALEEETFQDTFFYQNLMSELMNEINNYSLIQYFVANFAIQDCYDENDIIIYTGYSDCYDAISKFQILKHYENGFDIVNYYLTRNELTGEEEWDFPPFENSLQKAVRYTLHLKWNNTIPYMWNTSNSTIKTRVLLAMADWRSAADNKISFSEITKNKNWNKTCWVMGWKYFIRISNTNTNDFLGRSTVGMVPWALMDFTNGASYPRTYRHELGHSLGLSHEHQRHDRDDYITYYPNNVKSNAKWQYCKMPAGSYNYYGSSFDFNSIMIYNSWAGTKNNVNPAWTKKDGSTMDTLPSSISPTDQNVIRQIYN